MHLFILPVHTSLRGRSCETILCEIVAKQRGESVQGTFLECIVKQFDPHSCRTLLHVLQRDFLSTLYHTHLQQSAQFKSHSQFSKGLGGRVFSTVSRNVEQDVLQKCQEKCIPLNVSSAVPYQRLTRVSAKNVPQTFPRKFTLDVPSPTRVSSQKSLRNIASHQNV